MRSQDVTSPDALSGRHVGPPPPFSPGPPEKLFVSIVILSLCFRSRERPRRDQAKGLVAAEQTGPSGSPTGRHRAPTSSATCSTNETLWNRQRHIIKFIWIRARLSRVRACNSHFWPGTTASHHENVPERTISMRFYRLIYELADRSVLYTLATMKNISIIDANLSMQNERIWAAVSQGFERVHSNRPAHAFCSPSPCDVPGLLFDKRVFRMQYSSWANSCPGFFSTGNWKVRQSGEILNGFILRDKLGSVPGLAHAFDFHLANIFAAIWFHFSFSFHHSERDNILWFVYSFFFLQYNNNSTLTGRFSRWI